MTATPEDSQPGPRRVPAPRHRLSPKKLLLSKWTAAAPVDREKHFVVTQVIEPDLPGGRIQWVEIEAVHSGRSSTLAWRDLSDADVWLRGWV